MNETKRLYIELLQKALSAFTKIDLEEYELVTGDEDSHGVIANTLRRMIATVALSDDEAWGKEHPDRGED